MDARVDPTGETGPEPERTTFGEVGAPNAEADLRAREVLAGVVGPARPTATVPSGTPELLRLAGWLASCRDSGDAEEGSASRTPRADDCRLVVFAGDNGVVTAGTRDGGSLTALPLGHAEHGAAALQDGASPLAALASAADARVRLVDLCIDHEAWGDERVSRSCGAVDREDAMSAHDLERSLAIGRSIADQEIDQGAEVLLTGDLGAGATTVAAAVVGAVCRAEPVRLTGAGSGIDDLAWRTKTAAIRDAMFRVRRHRDSPRALLGRIGSPVLAASAGFLVEAAVRRTPVVLDGLVGAAAAIVAEQLAPGTRSWLLAPHVSAEPAHRTALNHLGLTPVVDSDLGLAQGGAALQAVPLLRTAAALLEAAEGSRES